MAEFTIGHLNVLLVYMQAKPDLPPTMNGVAKALGIGKTTVKERVDDLVTLGYLENEPRMARSIVPTDLARDEFSEYCLVADGKKIVLEGEDAHDMG